MNHEYINKIPNEIIEKIKIYAFTSLNDINPELYLFINSFNYKKYFCLRRKIKFAKSISRMRMKYNIREKMKYYHKLKMKKVQKELKFQLNS